MEKLPSMAKNYAAIILLLVFIVVLGVVSGGDPSTMQTTVNGWFGGIVGVMAKVLFWEFPSIKMPLVVVVLFGGAVFFTFRFTFINVRGFIHAIKIVSGKYDDPEDEGEVSHFQALASALSATVGLGNIAGVAIAVSIGGPGAVVWMMIAAVFGMTSKFAECTLGQMYRHVEEDGTIRGGPMVYLKEGLAEMGLAPLGKALSVIFAILCIGGSFGGGNMFQANQSFQAMASIIPALGGEKATSMVRITADEPMDLKTKRHLVKFSRPADEKAGVGALEYRPTKDPNISASDWKQEDGKYIIDVESVATASGDGFNIDVGVVTLFERGHVKDRKVEWTAPENTAASNIEKFRGGTGDLGWLYGLLLAVLVGIVIVGGIKRIGRVADKIVPVMCVLYVVCGLVILAINIEEIPRAVSIMFGSAFSMEAGFGGFIGVVVQGIRRAAFSNEAGVGSAAIAHSAAKTAYPVREGLVALLEPFIDTIVICFMTGIVIVVTGVYSDPTTAGLDGVLLTAAAFENGLGDYAGLVLSIAVVLFAFSTMISWSYYGERCWTYLFGSDQSLAYRIIFCFFIWIGCVASLGNVLDFSDLMILSMAFPNIIGVVLLSGKVSKALNEYMAKLKAGEFDES